MTVKQVKRIRLGTRGSPLALTQANMVKNQLARVAPELDVQIVVIKTSGDWKPEHGETRLMETKGGKGQFAKEIEDALLKGEVDAGVHSMKDMESNLPKGLIIDHMLPREDVRDCIILNNLANNVHNIKDLREGAVVGTASVRRASFIKALRSDIEIVPLRGNVQTRLEKLRRGEQGMQATVLALAGLKRLGLENEASFIVPVEDMVPCAGQGAVGIEIVQDRLKELSIFGQISDLKTVLCVKCERAALKVLDGTCHTPIGAYADLKQGVMTLRLKVASPDGLQIYAEQASHEVSTPEEAEDLGRRVGEKMKAKLPPGFLA